jgi:clan AA aspartic protease
MGLVHAEFRLTNVFTQQSVIVRALVDTGATDVFVTAEVARALGVDPEELSHANVTLADGRRVSVPRLPPLEIQFGSRSYYGTAFVMGGECLMGVIPLEAMDLVVDPKGQTLSVNPAYPDARLLRV